MKKVPDAFKFNEADGLVLKVHSAKEQLLL